MERIRSIYQTSKIVRTILKPFLQPNVQENVDLYRAGLALKCHNFCLQKNGGSPDEADVKKFYEEVDSYDQHTLKEFVQAELNKQVVDLFTKINGVVADDSNTIEKTNRPNFSLECRKSTLTNAGEGVFLQTSMKQDIPPGTVVAFHPGLVHLKEHLSDPSYLQSLLPDPDLMLMCRLDQTIVDSRHLTEDMRLNPYALGHKVNHCGKDKKPNVFQVSFDFPEDIYGVHAFPQQLRKYIPNQYAKPPSLLGKIAASTTTCMPSVLLISAQYINSGEELVMDYRLNPNSTDLPEWYEQYDNETSQARWE